MADSTPLISEGRKKEGKQGHRKVRVSIFIMRIQIMINIIKSLCFGYSLTYLPYLYCRVFCCCDSRKVSCTIPNYYIAILSVYHIPNTDDYIITLGDYLRQSYCFNSCNLGSDCHNHRKCFIRWLDDCILLYLYSILSSCNFRCHSLPSMYGYYLLDLAIYLVNYCYLANSCI